MRKYHISINEKMHKTGLESPRNVGQSLSKHAVHRTVVVRCKYANDHDGCNFCVPRTISASMAHISRAGYFALELPFAVVGAKYSKTQRICMLSRF
jgi:hypothetical protein